MSQPSQNPSQAFQDKSGNGIPASAHVVKTTNGDFVVQNGLHKGTVVFPVNAPPQQQVR